MKVYAVYKGEECLAIGTAKEIAEQLNIKPKTVHFYGTPAHKKRCKGKFGKTNHKILVSLDD